MGRKWSPELLFVRIGLRKRIYCSADGRVNIDRLLYTLLQNFVFISPSTTTVRKAVRARGLLSIRILNYISSYKREQDCGRKFIQRTTSRIHWLFSASSNWFYGTLRPAPLIWRADRARNHQMLIQSTGIISIKSDPTLSGVHHSRCLAVLLISFVHSSFVPSVLRLFCLKKTKFSMTLRRWNIIMYIG